MQISCKYLVPVCPSFPPFLLKNTTIFGYCVTAVVFNKPCDVQENYIYISARLDNLYHIDTIWKPSGMQNDWKYEWERERKLVSGKEKTSSTFDCLLCTNYITWTIHCWVEEYLLWTVTNSSQLQSRIDFNVVLNFV